MKYSTFAKLLRTEGCVKHLRSYDHIVEQLDDGTILVDGKNSEFSSLEEARTSIKEEHTARQLEEQIAKQLYEELSDTTVANIIKEHHDIKVTDTLIETYLQLASSNMFSVDPVVHKIRSLNKLDKIVEGKLHYVLADESIIAIAEQTQERLNNLLANQTEIIEHMRESKENFLSVLEKLEE